MEPLCRIRDLQRAIARFEAGFEQAYGLNLNEGMALCTLAGRDGLCSGPLADEIGLSPSNTSKVLRSLENKGLVVCTPGLEDRRQIRYSPTGAGRRLLQTINGTPPTFHPCCAGHSTADRNTRTRPRHHVPHGGKFLFPGSFPPSFPPFTLFSQKPAHTLHFLRHIIRQVIIRCEIRIFD